MKERVFKRYMQGKLAFTFIVITLALFALSGVLFKIIRENESDYSHTILGQQQYSSRTLPYRRGDIVDRNGTYIATNEKVYNLILDPKVMLADEGKHKETSINALVKVFGYDKGEITRVIEENAGSSYIRYERQMSAEQKEAFEAEASAIAADEANKQKLRVKGVWFEDEYKRIYPYDTLACNVIGFSNGDGTEGFWGIEQSYNNTLIGSNGREYGYLNDDSNLERVIKPAVNGNTVVSTIDVNVQKMVERRIEEFEAEMGAERTAVLVMDPKNSEVLAMASSITFNLNDPQNLDAYYTAEEQAAMDAADEELKARLEGITDNAEQEKIRRQMRAEGKMTHSDARNAMWRNYCISDTYEPGSTAKPFTVAAALEEGIVTPNNTFICDGFEMVGGWRIKCSSRYGHGLLTLEESLMVSCNDAMMDIGAKLGANRFSRYQSIFNLGARTGIDLPGEASTAGLLYTPERMDVSSLATNSFGQNFNVTMIQMASAYCSILNGGNYYVPRVAKQILNEQGAVVKKLEPVLVRETIGESTSNFLKKALFRTVSEGTGSAAAVPGYEIGGKTGTAEKYPRGNKKYLVSFMGFAPYDDPQVLVYVVVDVPNTEDQAHSTIASGIFQKVMADILPYLNVFPTDPGAMPTETAAPETSEGETLPVETNENGEPVETQPQKKPYPKEESVETMPATSEGETLPEGVTLPPDDPLPGAPPTADATEETTEEE